MTAPAVTSAHRIWNWPSRRLRAPVEPARLNLRTEQLTHYASETQNQYLFRSFLGTERETGIWPAETPLKDLGKTLRNSLAMSVLR